MRTYSRETFINARNAWRDGDFGPEWDFYRQLASDRGFIFPPNGTKFDSWEDDMPSQRSLIYRAIDETPRILTTAIQRSRNWSDVVAQITQARDGLREDAILREKDAEWEFQHRPRWAWERVGEIMAKIRDSAA